MAHSSDADIIHPVELMNNFDPGSPHLNTIRSYGAHKLSPEAPKPIRSHHSQGGYSLWVEEKKKKKIRLTANACRRANEFCERENVLEQLHDL